MIQFRKYQLPLVEGPGPGVVVLHWARQVGKSFTLAAWAVGRLIKKPGRLVTVLSNSRENGAEFVRKCAEVCQMTRQKFEVEEDAGSASSPRRLRSRASIENFRMEVRITVFGRVGRIKVLAANPRTARGFSGDLILDEFAFHEDSAAIWEAAEPILSSNPDFQCRIASTGNGKHNMFYRMVSGWQPTGNHPTDSGTATDIKKIHSPSADVSESAGEQNNRGEFFTSAVGFTVSRVTRTAAHAMGVPIL